MRPLQRGQALDPRTRSAALARTAALVLIPALLTCAGCALGAPAAATETAQERRTTAPAAPRIAAADTVLFGESISVQDGDSFVLRTGDGRKLRIRIEGIDAPEKGQPFADVSRRHLARLLRDRPLRLEVRKVDRYGRQVARVADGDTDVGLAQLQAGLAWFYRRYQAEQRPAERRAYAQAEARAREAGLGLWREEAPLPPWEHRQRQRAR